MMPSAPPGPTGIAQAPATADDPKALCARSLHMMADGDLRDFEALIHPDTANREAAREPMTARGWGPAAYYATALWLRGAFSDLRFDTRETAGSLAAERGWIRAWYPSGLHHRCAVAPPVLATVEGR